MLVVLVLLLAEEASAGTWPLAVSHTPTFRTRHVPNKYLPNTNTHIPTHTHTTRTRVGAVLESSRSNKSTRLTEYLDG